MTASIDDLVAVIKDLLANVVGYEHMTDDELRWEHEQGNGVAMFILKAREAIRDLP